jgi:hypothetical protein
MRPDREAGRSWQLESAKGPNLIKGGDMMGKVVAWVALGAAAVALTSVAGAERVAAKQRIQITGKGGSHTYVLKPLTGGALGRDSGTFSDCCWSERVIVRDGQRIEINDPIATYLGRHGTLVIRYRIEWVDAGNGYTVGTGTWKIIRGTGDYHGVTGHGRNAAVWVGNSFASVRAQGRVTGT